MTEFSEHIISDASRRKRLLKFQPLALILTPLVAVLFQVYVPRFFSSLSYLEFPLLVTVYFGLMRRSQVSGTLFGAIVGLLQDSLSHQPVGMFGIIKTLVGYFAASVSLRFDVENQGIRVLLGFFFFFFHQFFYWVMARALLGQALPFLVEQTLIFGLLNAVVALPLFFFLDKLRE